ncbi:Cysteine and histidine-rich domain-containing protein [Nymphaea thermarum]|nr:Cysteine and histidine-rich domain-containing protein [Nymphaea thermarum]
MGERKVRCQRIACDAMFTEDDNPEGCCRYHEGVRLSLSLCVFGPDNHTLSYRSFILSNVTVAENFGQPIFHDGMKEWSCCKQKSHDFSMFLQIPGYSSFFLSFSVVNKYLHLFMENLFHFHRCKTGKHTTEKPITKAAPSPNKPIPQPLAAKAPTDAERANCARCRQGFFCSDHGAQQVLSKHSTKPLVSPANSVANATVPPRTKVVDINEPQVCKNKGCGQTFIEKDNHEAACAYHPGPAIFHDRIKGWKCCDVHVKEFDEFMEIPPCAKGWHNANPAS